MVKIQIDGANMRRIREERRMTQAKLAEMVGFVGPYPIGRIENGQRPVDTERLCKIAKALQVDPRELVEQNVTEDKQKICDALLPVLRMTKNLADLESLEYRNDDTLTGIEIVICTFSNGYRRIANVTADSGTAMIKDLINQIV